MEQWPRDGVPANPRTWLVSAGRFKAIDRMRRRARFDASLVELAERLDAEARRTPEPSAAQDDEGVDDDRLRLVFTCCHPALTPDAQIALTLREVCGLTTEEIARAFLSSPPTVAQRIVRAKAKIRDARIPYQVPSRAELPDRLDSVLHVVYLVFNEGYAASSGDSLTRHDLSGEAIRLGRLLVELLPEPEAMGLLALMLLHESRRAGRTSAEGEIVLLDEQDRSLWNREQIAEGTALRRAGAVVAARSGPTRCRRRSRRVHAEAPTAATTDWRQIVGAVRRAAARRSVAGRGAESRRGDRDARRPRGGSRAHRRHPGAWRSRRLRARALGARGPLPTARAHRRGARFICARPRADAAGAAATVPRAAPRTVGGA